MKLTFSVNTEFKRVRLVPVNRMQWRKKCSRFSVRLVCASSAFTDVTLITRGITKIMILFVRIKRAKPYSLLKEPFHSNRMVNIKDSFRRRSNKRQNTQLIRLKVGRIT